jgi:hypothetical protein
VSLAGSFKTTIFDTLYFSVQLAQCGKVCLVNSSNCFLSGIFLGNDCHIGSPSTSARGMYITRQAVLEERVNHGIALSSERDEVDRKKRRAADTIHFLFP